MPVLEEAIANDFLVTELRYHNNITRMPTGIAIELPAGTFGFMHNKSGIGNRGILIFGGIIDEGYRGELVVQLANLAGEEIEYIKAGDKVAQLLVIPVLYSEIEEITELTTTDRGDKGFGSTGK